jgi:hypothetical protein
MVIGHHIFRHSPPLWAGWGWPLGVDQPHPRPNQKFLKIDFLPLGWLDHPQGPSFGLGVAEATPWGRLGVAIMGGWGVSHPQPAHGGVAMPQYVVAGHPLWPTRGGQPPFLFLILIIILLLFCYLFILNKIIKYYYFSGTRV